jgi:hypothetical protein
MNQAITGDATLGSAGSIPAGDGPAPSPGTAGAPITDLFGVGEDAISPAVLAPSNGGSRGFGGHVAAVIAYRISEFHCQANVASAWGWGARSPANRVKMPPLPATSARRQKTSSRPPPGQPTGQMLKRWAPSMRMTSPLR